MKKYMILGLAVLVAGCGELAPADNTDSPDSIARYYVEGKSISAPAENTGTTLAWEEGENTVIRYDAVHNGLPDTYDTGYTESLLVQVPNGLDAFSFSNVEEMLGMDIDMHYIRSCECSHERFILKSVQAKAQKQRDNTWFLAFEVEVSEGENLFMLKDEGNYVK